MITEAITITVTLGGCAAAALFPKSKFQPEIERDLARTESSDSIVASPKVSHT